MDGYALGQALLAGGAGLNTMAQDQFKVQINAANNAQRATLAQLAQNASMDRTQFTQGQENNRANATLNQNDNHFGQTFAETQAYHAATEKNQATNTSLRASEVASGNASRADTIKNNDAKTPAEIADLNARAAGADKLPAGVSASQLSTAQLEYKTAAAADNEAQKSLAAAQKNAFDTASLAKAQNARNSTKQALQDATAKLEGLSTGPAPAGGVSPASKPPAAGTTPAPVTRTDTTGKTWMLKNNQWVPSDG